MPGPRTASRWRSACGPRSSPAISSSTKAEWRPTSPPPIPRSRPTSSRTISRRWIPRISGSSIRSRAAEKMLFIFSVVFAAPLSAQVLHVSGRVLNADSSAVAGVRVVLHRVGQSQQGPLDSTRSDRQGRFGFSYAPDTSSFYLTSARYAGIEYFSAPLPTNPGAPRATISLMVYDTSSRAPVEMEARHLVLTRRGEEGSRSVLDLIIVRNGGRVTRVAPDTTGGSWSVPLPIGTTGLQVRESDVSSEALRRSGDSLVIAAALAPGEKQLTLEYQVPPGRTSIELPLNRAGMPLNVLVEEPAVRVMAPGVVRADSQLIQNRSFRRWTGTVKSAGMLRLVLPGRQNGPPWLLAALVGGLGIALVAGGWYAVRSRPLLRPGV